MSFIGSHTVKVREKKPKLNLYVLTPNVFQGVQKNGQQITVTADKFLVATGLRPRYLDVPGAREFCITR